MIIWAIFILIALTAAVADLLTFRIPNAIVIALLALFGVAAIIAMIRHTHIPWFNHLAAGILSLAVGLLLYKFRQMGAGDAKLLAVIALWAGLSRLIPLLFAVAVAGLLVLLVILLLRYLVAGRIREKSSLPRVLRKREGIPYGIGIALGAIVMSSGFPSWLWRM